MAIRDWRRSWVVSAAIALVGVVVLFALFIFKPYSDRDDVAEKQWSVAAITLPAAGSHAPQVHLYGQVEHSRLTQLSAAVNSHVEYVKVKEGQSVAAGQTLIQLDARHFQLTKQMHQADLDHVAAEISAEKANVARLEKSLAHQQELYDLAQASLDRYKDLDQKSYVSKEELNAKQREHTLRSIAYDNSQHELEMGQHRIAQLQAQQKKLTHQVERDQLDVAYCTVLSPEAGEITQVPAAVGEQVKPGVLLVEVMPHQQREVRALLPLSQVAAVKMQLGLHTLSSAQATVAGQPVVLHLLRLASEVAAGQVGQAAIFEAVQGGDHLVLGGHVSLYLSLADISNSYVIPESALYYSKQVYRIVDNRLQRVAVKVVGWKHQGMQREAIIQSDVLEEGDRVLISAMPNAINGLLVAETKKMDGNT